MGDPEVKLVPDQLSLSTIDNHQSRSMESLVDSGTVGTRRYSCDVDAVNDMPHWCSWQCLRKQKSKLAKNARRYKKQQGAVTSARLGSGTPDAQTRWSRSPGFSVFRGIWLE